MSRYCAGIDLGTTNTVCAVWEHDIAMPEVIEITQALSDFTPSGRGAAALLPSRVTVYHGAAWVGEATQTARLRRKGETFVSTKRRMGQGWSQRVGGINWTPERAAAAVLTTVRQELWSRFGEDPEKVVITVPASFSTHARRGTLQAAEMAGFPSDRVSLFDEPTAALLAESRIRRMDIADEPRRCMVIDIGGGTLDVSLVALSVVGGITRFDVQGQSRFTELAGDDFDLHIAGLLLSRFERDRGALPKKRHLEVVTPLCTDLLLQAEAVKKALSPLLRNRPKEEWAHVKRKVVVTLTPDGEPWETHFSGLDLHLALAKLFEHDPERSGRLNRHSFFQPLQECLESASRVSGHPISAKDIDRVWLVGGSSQMPYIGMAVENWLRAEAAPPSTQSEVVKDPLFSVAKGAAWYAGIKAGREAASIDVIDRLFDGLYLKLVGKDFETLVPPRQRAEPFRRASGVSLAMGAAGRHIEVNVLAGGDEERAASHGLRAPGGTWKPVLYGRIGFDAILPPGHPISLDVELTENREIRLFFHTIYRGETLTGQISGDVLGDNVLGEQLPLLDSLIKVNPLDGRLT